MIKQKDVIIRVLEALFPGVTIILFGSRARGTHRPTSDIDLALDTGEPLSFLQIAQAKNMMEALNVPEKIDIVDVRSVNPELQAIIKKEGVLWKNS
jgi:predicted nucleotidyltransferase